MRAPALSWKDCYPKSKAPAYSELLAFFAPDARALFERFDAAMRARFCVSNKYQRFSKEDGWTYQYGRTYHCCLLTMTVSRDAFCALGVRVCSEQALEQLLAEAEARYLDGFEDAYARVSQQKRAEQRARAKARKQKDVSGERALVAGADPAQVNRFTWNRKVAGSDLIRLYQSNAGSFTDERLLADIGLTFYLRCVQAAQVRAHLDAEEMVCLNCGAVLSARTCGSGAYTVLNVGQRDYAARCQCGRVYTYRAYRKNCNTVNMPGGRAAPIFAEYARRWPLCRDTNEQMLLIDWLVHQCHVTLMNGEKGRTVCVNLIEGTLRQLTALVNSLAYGAADAD